ncbi:uncharacterized protein LOC130612060 [Hydractinia symbiolongicarpus]|uniref:uncharacterized protein LOC130612060 n=1 Tax=Hydractinia symbiolongicarpus TaxID=13093 RepID=UPI0025503765|nr:uncharacterized protein LOC130612060 [Hydractinia symbiolongicarpus]XP_057289334.1 uncharacterized protein LOC130612060 [Hydractinia symbiolongicarpus]
MDSHQICFDLKWHKYRGRTRRNKGNVTFSEMLRNNKFSDIFKHFKWNSENVFYVAARYASLGEVKHLMSVAQFNKEKVEKRNTDGNDILTVAITNPDCQVIEYLLEELKLIPRYENSKSALNDAIEGSHVHAAAVLYERMYAYYLREERWDDQYFQRDYEKMKEFVKGFLRGSPPFVKCRKMTKLLVDVELFKQENFNSIFLYAIRYSSIKMIHFVFDKIKTILGSEYFENDLKDSIDANGEDVLTVLARYRINRDVSEDQFKDLFTKYQLRPDNYSHNSQLSALYYVIENKSYDLVLFLLKYVNTRDYSDYQRRAFIFTMRIFQTHLSEINLKDEQTKREWTKAVTTSSWKCSSGRQAKCYPGSECLRYKTRVNKAKQMLRYISTQLFYYWKYVCNIESLTEVQVMQVQTVADSFQGFFISFNPITENVVSAITQKLQEWRDSGTTLREIIQKNYAANIPENLHRATRYSKKVKKLIVERWIMLLSQLPIVLTVLRERRSQTSFQCQDNGVYLLALGHHACKYRHAEEWLCDVADHLRKTDEKKYTFRIYGKKRPCVGCCGRMMTSKIDDYNKNSGYYWVHTIEQQSEEVARNTFKLAIRSVPNITVEWGTKIRDYDTASDSE